jgi:aspartate aminotransferase
MLDPSVLKHMMLSIARDLVVGLLQDIPGIKINVPGAFYVFPDVSSFFGKNIERN